MQINTGLKLGVMWDHNGTYMESFGFQYRDQQIQIGLTAENDLAGDSSALDAGCYTFCKAPDCLLCRRQ